MSWATVAHRTAWKELMADELRKATGLHWVDADLDYDYNTPGRHTQVALVHKRIDQPWLYVKSFVPALPIDLWPPVAEAEAAAVLVDLAEHLT